METRKNDELASLLKKYLEEKANNESSKLRCTKERIYDVFLNYINHSVYNKYRYVFRAMDFDTSWDFDSYSQGDYSLTNDCVSFYMIYTPEDDGESEYEPLIKFCFALGQDTLNIEHAEEIFRKIDERLGKCLKNTYKKWTKSMAEYYGNMYEHYKKRACGDFPTNPMDDPEEYFLTHEVVFLD